MNPLDQWTRQVDQALRWLFLKDPERAALGVLVGLALSSSSVLFAPGLKAVPIINVSAMSWWSWLPLGIGIMFSTKIWLLLKKPSVGTHAFDAVLASIERANFTAVERRQQYRKVIDRYLECAAAEYTLRKQQSVLAKSALD
jgi:hypothetical protein